MPSVGRVKLKAVFDMLDECAPGYTCKPTTHFLRFRYAGKTYPSFPKGEHGRKRISGNAEIEMGHVRQLVRHLNINCDCANRMIPALKIKKA